MGSITAGIILFYIQLADPNCGIHVPLGELSLWSCRCSHLSLREKQNVRGVGFRRLLRGGNIKVIFEFYSLSLDYLERIIYGPIRGWSQYRIFQVGCWANYLRPQLRIVYLASYFELRSL